MYKRRRILLALIEAFDGKVERLRLQKLLFLLCHKLDTPPYFFLPYRYGCFSFQANMDLLTLEKKHVVKQNPGKMRVMSGPWIDTLTGEERQKIREVKHSFGSLSDTELIRYTYIHFPFFATRSTIAEDILEPDEVKKIRGCLSVEISPMLMTLGYEGLTLEQYMNVLVEQNIRLLCDVRKNAMSMKYGFSKKTLATACESVGIEYAHFPEVGIVSDKRKNLRTREDYQALFAEYRETVLRDNVNAVAALAQRILSCGRAALLCFEKNPALCHRSHLANALNAYLPPSFRIHHTNA
jgi:hypothetical protein